MFKRFFDAFRLNMIVITINMSSSYYIIPLHCVKEEIWPKYFKYATTFLRFKFVMKTSSEDWCYTHCTSMDNTWRIWGEKWWKYTLTLVIESMRIWSMFMKNIFFCVLNSPFITLILNKSKLCYSIMLK